MLSFNMIQLLLQLLGISLMKSMHLLYLQIQSLDLFIFICNLGFQIPLFTHDLFHIEVSILEEVVVGDMS